MGFDTIEINLVFPFSYKNIFFLKFEPQNNLYDLIMYLFDKTEYPCWTKVTRVEEGILVKQIVFVLKVEQAEAEVVASSSSVKVKLS